MRKALVTIVLALVTAVSAHGVQAGKATKAAKARPSTALTLASHHDMVVDGCNGRMLVSKNDADTVPIASIIKLMKEMVVLVVKLQMDGTLTDTSEEVRFM